MSGACGRSSASEGNPPVSGALESGSEGVETTSVRHVTDAEFDSVIAGTDKPVLVDLWAPWCGPCRRLGPIIDELARDFAGRAVITKINVDQNKKIPGRYRVQSIPTILIFHNGELKKTLVGLQRKETLADILTQLHANK
ncbi:thioredoxin [bacterium]|nr:thioredoxin [candidate division CSSED10-310 bacterium]